jgi:general secretion pathway protein G
MDNLYNRVARRRRRRGQGGFTLIELLVVIAVLAILAAIVIFNVVGVTNRGSTSACSTDVKSVQTATDAYYNDPHGTPPVKNLYPVTGGDTGTPGATATVNIGELVPAYLHTTPTSSTAWNIDANGTVTSNGHAIDATHLDGCK